MKIAAVFLLLLWGVDSQESFRSTQSFLRHPSHQTAVVGEHVTLACRVLNKEGVLQWTRDGFGLGNDRELEGFKRYRMTGSDEEGKQGSNIVNFLEIQALKYCTVHEVTSTSF